MMTKPNHPLAEQYFAELSNAAARLPRAQRTELLAEIRSHLDTGMSEATSESDIRNMLDALGPPEDIVEASAPSNNLQGPSGRLAFGLGIVGLLLAPTLVFGIILGIAAILLGAHARRFLVAETRPTTLANFAIIIGFVAVILPVVMVGLLEATI